MNVLGLIGLIVGIAFLMYCCMKGINLYISTMVTALIIIVTNQMPILVTMNTSFFSGFGSFFASWTLLYLAGALFGKFMEITGSATAVAKLILKFAGKRFSVIAMCVAIGLLGYGGVTGFAIVFAAFPFCLQVFREANLPRRFIPCIMIFGMGTFLNSAPGSPQGLNVITTETMGLPLTAGPLWGAIAAIFCFVMGSVWLTIMMKKAVAAGECFVVNEKKDNVDIPDNLPNGFIALLPMMVTCFLINFKVDGTVLVDVRVGLLIGALLCILLNYTRIPWNRMLEILGTAATGNINICGTIGTVVAIGYVVQATPVFQDIVTWVTSLQISPFVSLIIAVNVMAAVTGSATSACSLMTPILGPIYVGMGLDPGIVARTIAVGSTGFDSMPHNGAIVLAIDMAGCNHKEAYMPIFKTCAITPICSCIFMTICYTFFG